jgi:hypothetical protein
MRPAKIHGANSMTRPSTQSLKIAVTLLCSWALFFSLFGTQQRNVLAQIGQDAEQKPTPEAMPMVTDRISAAKESERTEDFQVSTLNDFGLNAIAPTSYIFNNTTGIALDDMSTGTTQLAPANSDDGASTVQNIGFDFWYDGVRMSQFSCNANGLCRMGSTVVTTEFDNGSATFGFASTTNAPKIAPYFDDLWTGSNGKVHYKVTGSAPNRKLVVEWLNEQIPRVASGSLGAGTFQMWLFETSGVIEFVYGPGMAVNTPNGGYSIGLQSGVATNFVSVTSAGPTASYVTANNTQTNAIASGTAYIFTPQTAIAPSGLNFTSTTALSTALNWSDNSSNEVGFAIYRSTDGGVTYSFLTQTAADAISFTDNTVLPGTNYFYRVMAVTEGALSSASQNDVTTPAAGNISSTGAGGLWSSPATWIGGVVPIASDNVTIVDGATVTIDTAAAGFSITVGTGGAPAVLQFEATTARTLTVGSNVTIGTNGTFQSSSTGTQTGHLLSLAGNLVNNGTLDFSTNANTAAAGIVFTGSTNNYFSGTGPTTDVFALTINKGTAAANILELLSSNFTVQGAATDVAGFLTLTNGTFKISGNFSVTNRVFTAAAYSIPATAGFWLNNPNFVVTGQTGSPTTSGLLRISQGAFNVGTAVNNSMAFNANSTVIVEGGIVTTAGRFGVTAGATAFTYYQSGGLITVCTVGSTSTAVACYDLGTSASSTISITGGTVVHQLASTAASGPRDYRNQAGSGIAGVTAGTVQFGSAASGAAKTYSGAGIFPNLAIDNTSANHALTLLAPVNFNNTSLNLTINTGTTLNIGNNPFFMNGATFTNNGTLTGNGASSNFNWSLTTAPVTYTGTGNVTAPLTIMSFQADQGVTFNPAVNNVVVNAVRLFSGNVTNSNKITLGNGGSTTGIVQIGNTPAPSAPGSFDVPFTFNLGTGGQTISYLRTTASRTTGPEINPTRTLTSMTYDDNDPAHTLTIAGGNLTLANTGTALTLSNGRVITGPNILSLSSSTATVSRTNGYVDGYLRKNFGAAAAKNFEVGTANGFSPATVNVTAGFPGDVTVKAVQSKQPNIPGTNALQRYWKMTAPAGFTADLTMQYLASDVVGDETSYLVYKYAGTFTNPGGSSVNSGTHQILAPAQSAFSADWTAAEPSAVFWPGTVQFSSSNYSVSEAGGIATITVTRSGGSSGPASVNFTTSNGTAVGGAACTPGVDFVNTNGTLNWADTDAADKTFNVTICDESVFENDETINLSLGGASGATLGAPATSVLTITNDDAAPPPANPGDLVISEYRLHGPAGTNSTTDEYIEIYNRTGADFAVGATDGPGFSVAASAGAVLCVIPNGTIIPARGHFLCANSTGYSLSSYATADATYSVDISDADGIALFNTANPANIGPATRLDAVGFVATAGSLYKEGSGIVNLVTGDGQYALVRKYAVGVPVDTDDNNADFVFTAIDGGVYGATAQRGAPGPENLTSPIENNVKVPSSLIDNTQPASASPNRVRDTTPGAGPTTFGTLDIRRKFTNNSGQTIDTLRFRIVEVTTTNTPLVVSPQADLRLLTSVDTTANGGTITIVGSTVEAPSDPVNGGGLNSTVTVAIPGGLAAGDSINVRFLLGVAAPGNFKFYLNAEPTGAGLSAAPSMLDTAKDKRSLSMRKN